MALLKPDEIPAAIELEKLGEVEGIRKKAKKLAKSIDLTGPRECTPDGGTIPPFGEPQDILPKEDSVEKPVLDQPEQSSPLAIVQPEIDEKEVHTPTQPLAQKTANKASNTDTPLTEDGMPIVGEEFDPLNLTPAQLKKLSDDYKNNPEDMINEILQEANFMPPQNPSEYLPSMQEEQLNDAGGSPQLAAERAALGPKGKQGGNPHLALKKGGAVNIPPSNENVYQKAQKHALEQENRQNKKALFSSVEKLQGPSVDEQTLDILKTLKPEE